MEWGFQSFSLVEIVEIDFGAGDHGQEPRDEDVTVISSIIQGPSSASSGGIKDSNSRGHPAEGSESAHMQQMCAFFMHFSPIILQVGLLGRQHGILELESQLIPKKTQGDEEMLPIEVPFTRFTIEDKEVALRVMEMRTREGVFIYAFVSPLEFDDAGYPRKFHFMPYRLGFRQCPSDIDEGLHTAMAEALTEHVVPLDPADPQKIEADLDAAYAKIAEVILAMSLSLQVDDDPGDFFEVSFAYCLDF